MISNILCIFIGLAYVQARDSPDELRPRPRPGPGPGPRPARCPAIRPNQVGICANTCGRSIEDLFLRRSDFRYRRCPAGQICCPTACGGRTCRKPITNTGCPGDLANCFVDPCQFATCPLYPHAKKRSSYCGGCFCFFYVGKREVTKFCNRRG